MANLTEYFAGSGGSNVIEVVHGSCDGRSITTESGTYTLPTVTGGQSLSTSYADITGSSFTYTPPNNAKYVSYKFDFHWDSISSSGISHWMLLIDGTEIVKSHQNFSSNYSGSHGHHHGAFEACLYTVFDLTASTTNAAAAQFADWTSDKTIKVQARNYNATDYRAQAHGLPYHGSTTFGGQNYTRPSLTIIAFS